IRNMVFNPLFQILFFTDWTYNYIIWHIDWIFFTAIWTIVPFLPSCYFFTTETFHSYFIKKATEKLVRKDAKKYNALP
ncbi:hypothetical protein LCGC14_3020590, partial [marine sediment metagenome]